MSLSLPLNLPACRRADADRLFVSLCAAVYGADPTHNPQLAACIAAAKKASVPKATIDAAIARGQGRSAEGASLEPLTLSMVTGTSPAVALIVDAETDSRARTLQLLRTVAKRHKATAGSAEFFFRRAGRVVFAPGGGDGAAEGGEGGGGGDAPPATAPVGVEDVMDAAIEAGAEDLEADEEGNIVVWTGPGGTSQIVGALGGGPSAAFDLKVLSSAIVWTPVEETRAPVDSAEEVGKIADLAAALRENPDVQAIYSNATRGEGVSEEEWARLDGELDE